MDILLVRTPVGGRGQLQQTATRLDMGKQFLDRPFAVGALPQDHGTAIVLQAGGENFAGTGTVLIDEHGQRQLGVAAAACGDKPIAGFLVAPAGGDNRSPGTQEEIANADGCIKCAAGVVAHVEYQPFDRRCFVFCGIALGGQVWPARVLVRRPSCRQS